MHFFEIYKYGGTYHKTDHSKLVASLSFLQTKQYCIYEMPKQLHEKLLHDNVTKTCRKVPPKLINLEGKNIAELVSLDDRI